MKKQQPDQEQLENFIIFCKKEFEFLYLKTYTNSIILYFKSAILTSVFIELIKTNHNFFIYDSIDIMNEKYSTCLCLFIYKKFDYDFN